MSDDYISGLQRDLVEAMERYEQRAPRRAVAAALRPRPPRWGMLARLAAAAAIAVAVAVALPEFGPEEPPARPRVVAALPLGGSPVDATLAQGSVWATDFTGSVVQVDPDARRVIGRTAVPGAAHPIASGAGNVWVQTEGMHCEGSLVRIDAATGRIAGRMPMAYPSARDGALAAVSGDVWAKRGCAAREGVDRLDPAGTKTASVTLASVDGLATAGEDLWALGHDGTVTRIEAADGRVRHRWPGLAPLSDPNTSGTKALVADDGGAWVVSTGRGAIIRIDGDRVVREIPVPASTRPLLARASGGLWIATADRLGSRNRLVRIDPATGRPTATVELREQRPVALVPAGDELCVLTADGKLLFVR
jgi:hypothetical protein